MKLLILLLLSFLIFVSHAVAVDIGEKDGHQVVFTNGTPSFYQMALSTTVPNITQDQIKTFTAVAPTTIAAAKAAIVDKVIDLMQDYVAVERFIQLYPAFTTPGNNKLNKIKAEVDLLQALYSSL